jgi:hypothetical protein
MKTCPGCGGLYVPAIEDGTPCPHALSSGVEAIAAERARQVRQEGWTPEHDDGHGAGDLAYAAACYTFVAAEQAREERPPGAAPLIYWPWDSRSWKPKDARNNLVRAGALIAAEIDRLDRAAQPQEAQS